MVLCINDPSLDPSNIMSIKIAKGMTFSLTYPDYVAVFSVSIPCLINIDFTNKKSLLKNKITLIMNMNEEELRLQGLKWKELWLK